LLRRLDVQIVVEVDRLVLRGQLPLVLPTGDLPTANPLPTAEPAGHTGRDAISSPMAISTTPNSDENAVTLMTS
jgi:hypothetical protein